MLLVSWFLPKNKNKTKPTNQKKKKKTYNICGTYNLLLGDTIYIYSEDWVLFGCRCNGKELFAIEQEVLITSVITSVTSCDFPVFVWFGDYLNTDWSSSPFSFRCHSSCLPSMSGNGAWSWAGRLGGEMAAEVARRLEECQLLSSR